MDIGIAMSHFEDDDGTPAAGRWIVQPIRKNRLTLSQNTW
jgi:hypothetical protein